MALSLRDGRRPSTHISGAFSGTAHAEAADKIPPDLSDVHHWTHLRGFFEIIQWDTERRCSSVLSWGSHPLWQPSRCGFLCARDLQEKAAKD
jgi:hypothetical protein